ncbi:MAG: hypothetical protein H7A25_12130 [Leptospiraceae bacterium]|nr:hypothetical protein [Leptospiraceae bacterium]MCP5500647.1 hypothetical protein [Leptospiraceae bacterium]
MLFFICIFYLFLTGNLLSQYASYEPEINSASAAGMASSGLGNSDMSIALYENQGFLLYKNQHHIGGGFVFPKQARFAAAEPLSAAFFIRSSQFFGWGISGKSTFSRHFPHEERNLGYAVPLHLSFGNPAFGFFTLSAGPSFYFRENILSSYSVYLRAAYALSLGDFSIGLAASSPGKFRLDEYRNADKLRERQAESIDFGIKYNFSQNFAYYTELRKILWEKSAFELNGMEEKPDFERGIGAEAKISQGLSYSFTKRNTYILKTGLEFGGYYNEKGENVRRLGLALGLGIQFANKNRDETDALSFHLSVLDYSLIRSQKEKRAETRFYASLHYSFGDYSYTQLDNFEP